MKQADQVTIESRYCGPPASANGGYACGLLGSRLSGAAEVTLHSPPPLDTPLEVRASGHALLLLQGEHLVATAVPSPVDIEIPGTVSFAEAEEASRHYVGFDVHPFGGCFVCGPDRAPGDGLRIFAGPVAGRSLAAAPWVPEETFCDDQGIVRAECVWAALDCPSYFGIHAHAGYLPLALLGRLAVRVDRRPRASERCVALGWVREIDGRKFHTASALLGEDSHPLAWGRSTWIALKT